MHKRFFNFSSDGSVGNIDIFGSIGEDWWADDGGNTAKKIKDLIDQVSKTNCSAYHVRINSLGGEVDAALAIHRLLASLPNVTTECIGFCASAATVIFMAGKERLIAKNALFLITNAPPAPTATKTKSAAPSKSSRSSTTPSATPTSMPVATPTPSTGS